MKKDILLWQTLNQLRGGIPINQLAKLFVAMSGFKFISEKDKLNYNLSQYWDPTKMGLEMENMGRKYDLEIFKDISSELKEMPESVYRDIYNSINSINYDNAINFAETMVHFLTTYSGRYEEVTPGNVFKVPLSLLEIKDGETIVDYFNGTSSLHLEVLKNNPGIEIKYYGQEINKEAYEIGQFIEYLLSGDKDRIIKGDSLRNPGFTDGEDMKKFDYAISVPPFGMDIHSDILQGDKFDRFKYLANKTVRINSEWIIIQQLLSSIKKNGKAAILMPSGVLFRGGREAEIRKAIVQEDLIEVIIKLPENLLPYTGIGSYWILFNRNKPKKRKNKIQFIDLSPYLENMDRKNKAISEEGIKKVVRDYKEFDSNPHNLILDINELEEKQFNLNAFDFVETDKIYEELGDEKLSLSKVAMIRRGVQVTKPKMDALNAADKKTHYMVTLGSIDENGNIKVDETDLIAPERRWLDLYEAKPGDILITSRGNLFKITIVGSTEEKYIISSNLFIIRLDQSQYRPEIFKFFLESDMGQRLVESIYKGSVVTSISNSDLENLLIPDIPMEKQNEMVQIIISSEKEYIDTIKEAKERYNTKKNEVNNILFK